MRRAEGVLGAAIALMLSHAPLMARNEVLAEIPIELERNKTIVPVTVASQAPLRLLLDSGMAYDGVLLFDSAKVDLTRFEHLVDIRIEGAGSQGASAGRSDESGTFLVGSRKFENQRVTILGTDAFKGFPTDGVVGYSLLGHYAVEVDHDRGRMILYEPSTFAPGEGWKSIDIYFKSNRIPWTDISVATAEEAPVRISTYIDCASGEALELLKRDSNVFTLPVTSGQTLVGRGLSGDILPRALRPQERRRARGAGGGAIQTGRGRRRHRQRSSAPVQRGLRLRPPQDPSQAEPVLRGALALMEAAAPFEGYPPPQVAG